MISRSEVEEMLTDFTKFYVKKDFTLNQSFSELGVSDIDKVEILIAAQFKTKTWLEKENALRVTTLSQLVDLIVEKAEENDKENSRVSGNMLKLTLLYHPMCPFAQRILYVINFKGAPVDLVEIDMTNKPDWFYKENPENFFPVLKVETDSRKDLIRNSTTISEFIEDLPGPRLFPVRNGQVDKVAAALLKMHLFELENMRKLISAIYHFKEFKDYFILDFQKQMRKVNSYVDRGKFFSSSITGNNEFSFIDLMLFPWIERILAFKSLGLKCYENLNLFDLEIWFQKTRQHECIKKSLLPAQSYIKLRKMILSGEYKGLVLPVSAYSEN